MFFQETHIDWRLIEAFSSFIFEFVIVFCKPIRDETIATRLWQTVNKCDNLQKLTYYNRDEAALGQILLLDNSQNALTIIIYLINYHGRVHESTIASFPLKLLLLSSDQFGILEI